MLTETILEAGELTSPLQIRFSSSAKKDLTPTTPARKLGATFKALSVE